MKTTEARRVALESGATTTVECWGDAGPAILCVHGISSSRRDFARLGEALQDERGSRGCGEQHGPLQCGPGRHAGQDPGPGPEVRLPP